MALHSSILAWKIPWAEKPGVYSPWDCRMENSWATEQSLRMSHLQTAKIKLREVGCLAQGHTAGTESTFLIPFTSVLFLHSPEHLTKTGPWGEKTRFLGFTNNATHCFPIFITAFYKEKSYSSKHFWKEARHKICRTSCRRVWILEGISQVGIWVLTVTMYVTSLNAWISS